MAVGMGIKKGRKRTRAMNMHLDVGDLIPEKWKNLLTEIGNLKPLEGPNAGSLREEKQFH